MSTTSIHGHDILHLIIEADPPHSLASLHAAVLERHGATARFHTCAAEDLDFPGLMEFLQQRGKLAILPDGSLCADPDRMCAHE